MANIDIKLIKIEDDLFDIGIADNGDFVLEDGFDTAIYISLYAEKRANSSEMPIPDKRRGWIGNLFSVIPNYEIGSKMWLLDQTRRNSTTLIRAQGFANSALKWMKDQGYADKIESKAEFTREGIRLNIKIYRKNDLVASRSFILWSNTGD